MCFISTEISNGELLKSKLVHNREKLLPNCIKNLLGNIAKTDPKKHTQNESLYLLEIFQKNCLKSASFKDEQKNQNRHENVKQIHLQKMGTRCMNLKLNQEKIFSRF